MKTKTVGELLRAEREAHRLTLEEMANRTRVRLEYLQALEQNAFDQLPAATFVKGYIRAYARLFGFDHQPLIALLRRDYKESAQGQLVPREFIKPLLKQQPLWSPVTLVVLVIASVFITLLSYVGWQWYRLNQPPELLVAEPVENATVASQINVRGRTSSEAIVSVNAQPVALEPDGSFSTQVFIPREGISTLTIEATDRRGKTRLIQRTVYVRF